MNHYELLLTHMGTVLQWQYLIPLLAGTIAGVIGGALLGAGIIASRKLDQTSDDASQKKE